MTCTGRSRGNSYSTQVARLAQRGHCVWHDGRRTANPLSNQMDQQIYCTDTPGNKSGQIRLICEFVREIDGWCETAHVAGECDLYKLMSVGSPHRQSSEIPLFDERRTTLA